MDHASVGLTLRLPPIKATSQALLLAHLAVNPKFLGLSLAVDIFCHKLYSWKE